MSKGLSKREMLLFHIAKNYDSAILPSLENDDEALADWCLKALIKYERTFNALDELKNTLEQILGD